RITGNYGKAAPLYERALAIRQKVFGEQHPDTATSLNNLANLYQSMGDYAKAKPLYERALKIWEKVLGPEQPRTALSLNNLAGLYLDIGDYAKAEPLFERSLTILEKVLGSEHLWTALSLNNLARLELDMTKIGEARALALRSEKPQLKILSNILSFCSESRRLAYQNTLAPYTLFAAIDGSDSELASACLRYKGLVLDSIIEDRVLAERSENKEDHNLVRRLNTEKQ